eukprot:11198327-Lingulodinium_polyedra.AAC.1
MAARRQAPRAEGTAGLNSPNVAGSARRNNAPPGPERAGGRNDSCSSPAAKLISRTRGRAA